MEDDDDDLGAIDREPDHSGDDYQPSMSAPPAQQDDGGGSIPLAQFRPDPPEGGSIPVDQFVPDEQDHSAGGAFAYKAKRAIIPAIGSLPAMGYGAGVFGGLGATAGSVLGPVGAGIGGTIGAIGGGVAGAMAGGAAISAVQKKIFDKLGWNNDAQEETYEREHPYASMAGELAPNLAAFRPGKLADSLVDRLLAGGLMGGLEAGQELGTEGKIDPVKVGMSTAFGMATPKPTAVGEAGMGLGSRFVPKAARDASGRVDTARGVQGLYEAHRQGTGVDTTPPVDPDTDRKQVSAGSEPLKSSIGTAPAAPAPNQNVTGIGNERPAGSTPVGDKGNTGLWQKRVERKMAETPEMVEPGQLPADVALAMEKPKAENQKPAEPAGTNELTNQQQTQNPVVQKSAPPPVPETSQQPAAPPPAAPTPAAMERLGRMQRPKAEPGTGPIGEGGLIPRFPGQREQPPPGPSQPVRSWDKPLTGDLVMMPELGRVVKTTSLHDVPWLAGPSEDGRSVHFDARMPNLIDVGNGKMLNPKYPVIIHEVTEQAVYKKMEADPRTKDWSDEKRYNEAHKIATQVEDAALAKRGYTPEEIKSYNGHMDALAKQTESQRADERHPPPDLWTKVYPKVQQEALARQGAPAPSPEVAIDLHRVAREAPAKIQKKFATQQKGEMFAPEAAKFDQPNPVLDRTPVRPEHARQEPIAEAPKKPLDKRRTAEEVKEAIERTKAAGYPMSPPEKPTAAQTKPRVLEDLTRPEHWQATTHLTNENLPKREATVAAPKAEPKVETPEPDLRPASVKRAELQRVPRGSLIGNMEKLNAARNPPEVKAPKGMYEIKNAAGDVIGHANSIKGARQRTHSLRIAADMRDRFAERFDGEFNINKGEDVERLRAVAKEAVEAAKGDGWTKYMPRQVKEDAAHRQAPSEALWMDEVKAFADGRKRDGKKYTPADFIARERLLRRGDEEAVQSVRDDRLEQGDRAKKKIPEGEVTDAGNEDALDAAHEYPPADDVPLREKYKMNREAQERGEPVPYPMAKEPKVEVGGPETPAFGRFTTTDEGKPRGMSVEEYEDLVKPISTVKVAGLYDTPVKETTTVDKLLNPETGVFSQRLSPTFREIGREVWHQEPNLKVHVMDRDTWVGMQKKIKLNPAALYDSHQHQIYLQEGFSPEFILHEAVHGITSRRLNSNPEFLPRIRAVMEEVRPSVEKAMRGSGELKEHPGMFNEKEFLAYGMSNRDFQVLLANVKLKPGTVRDLELPKQAREATGWSTGFKAFVNVVRKIMGLKEGEHNALEAVVKLTDEARRLPDRTSEKPPTKPFGRRNNPDPIANDLLDKADVITKQKRAPWALRLRDTDRIAENSDHLFEGADKNPIRHIADAIEGARVDSLKNNKADMPLFREGLALQKKHNGPEWDTLQTLMQRESMVQRFGDLPLGKQGFDTRGGSKLWRDQHHPELERMFNSLPDALKDYRAKLYDFAEKRLDDLGEKAAENSLLKQMGFTDTNLVKRIMGDTYTRADFDKLGADDRDRFATKELIQLAGKQAAVTGPYTPQMRYGKYVVTGLYKTPEMAGAKKINDNQYEFANKADAEAAVKAQHGEASITPYHVYDGPAAAGHTPGERYSKVTEPVKKDGVEQIGPDGNPLTYEKQIAYSKNDPNVSPRWLVGVERGYMSQHDTYKEAIAHHKELEGLKEFDKVDTQPKKYTPHTDAVTLAHNLTDLEKKLPRLPGWENMSSDSKAAVKQALSEHYLNMLSATRLNNPRLKRNYIPGASDDVLRNFLSYSQTTSAELAMKKHQPVIDKARNTAEDMVNKGGTEFTAGRRAVLNEMDSRLDAMKSGFFSIASGQMGPGLHRLMSVSAMARLATPGFTIRNLTQSALFLGNIAGRHGFGAAGRELMRAYKDIGAGGILKSGVKDTGKAAAGKLTDPASMFEAVRNNLTEPREQRMIDYIGARGRMDPDAGWQIAPFMPHAEDAKVDFRFGRSHGIEQDNAVTRGIEKGLRGADRAIHYMEEISRQMPRAAETVNRGSTALTAYRLEYKKLIKEGKSPAEAEKLSNQYADDQVRHAHFVYSETNKPVVQRNPWMRAAFQFKQFGKSVYELMGKHVMNSINRDVPKEDRAAARKALGGLFVAHTMVAGALGLPWEPVRAMLLGAKTIGVTSKDWDDVENGVREALTGVGNLAGMNEKNAKLAGEAMAKGLPRLLGVDMNPGLGIDNMLLFSSPRNGSDKDFDNNMMAWLFQMGTGAPTALGMQYFHGMRDLLSGNYSDGIAKLMPMKIGSDVTKVAADAVQGGKFNARGRQTKPEYSVGQGIAKAMGIPVAEDAERGAYQHAVYQEGQEKKDDKNKAIAAWIAAKTPDDKAAAFKTAREAGVTAQGLSQAAQRERSAQKRIVNGVVTTRDTKPIAERLRKVYNVE